MLNEASGVAAPISGIPERVLERCQGAYPTGEFYDCAPGNGRDVEPWKPAPTKCQECAEDGEGYESGVNDEHEICQDAVDHCDAFENLVADRLRSPAAPNRNLSHRHNGSRARSGPT
jgi:dethiobiotin synthetase